MGLTPECSSYVGGQVLVEPVYGYGWTEQVPDSSGTYPSIDVPIPFHMTIDCLFESQGELMGGLGTIQESGHALDGHRISFSVRHRGQWDFVSKTAHYNLAVGSTERVADNGWLLAVGAPYLVGFGVIRDDAA